MTNPERDTLLINLATSVNNINNTLNDFRSEMKQTEKALTAKIDEVAKNAHTELKQTENSLRAEIKQTENNLMAKIELEAKATSEIIHDTWARQRKAEERLDSHDAEIREIKSKLA